MASVKKIAKPVDEGSQEMFACINTLKTSHSELSQLSKLAAAHHAATAKFLETGKQFADHVVKVGAVVDPRVADLSETMMRMSVIEKTVFKAFEDVNKVLEEQLSIAVANGIKQESQQIAALEKSHKAGHNRILAELRKAEKNSAKAGKKSATQLQSALQLITKKTEEMHEHRRNSLEQALKMERKKWCDFISQLTMYMDAQISTFDSAKATLTGELATWKQAASTSDKIDTRSKGLLESMAVSDRTTTAIDASAPYEDDYYEEDEYYEEEYYEEAGGYGGGGERYRALYDYVGQHDYELQFRAGDIIMVTAQDAATGWWTGELNGVVGPFPGNYVQRA